MADLNMRFLKTEFPKRDKINLAFSCGKDSIVFSHFLKFKCRKQVILHHVNNKIDGDDLIESKTREYSQRFNFELRVYDSPVEIENEESCRNARINALHHLDHIVTCHHLGDAVEQYLMNCFRGHNEFIPGTPLSFWKECFVYRPFLRIHPDEIKNYLIENQLNLFIAEDILSGKSKRHWLRKELIPSINGNGYNLFKTVKRKIENGTTRKKIKKTC